MGEHVFVVRHAFGPPGSEPDTCSQGDEEAPSTGVGDDFHSTILPREDDVTFEEAEVWSTVYRGG